MAFSADELRVIRRALAIALRPRTVFHTAGQDRAEEVENCLRLADAVEEAVREGERLRAFRLAELVHYRAAVPGAARGYLDRLQHALAAGYEPLQEDLAALRTLSASPAGPGETERRRALLRHCERQAERGARARLGVPPNQTAPVDHVSAPPHGSQRRHRQPAESRDAPRQPQREPKPGPPPGAPGRPGPANTPENAPQGPQRRPKPGPPEPKDAPRQPKGEPRKPKGEPRGEPKGEPRGEPKGEPRGEPKGEPRKKPGGPAPGDRAKPSPGAPPPGRRPVPTPAEVFPPKRRPPRPPRRQTRFAPGRVPGMVSGATPPGLALVCILGPDSLPDCESDSRPDFGPAGEPGREHRPEPHREPVVNPAVDPEGVRGLLVLTPTASAARLAGYPAGVAQVLAGIVRAPRGSVPGARGPEPSRAMAAPVLGSRGGPRSLESRTAVEKTGRCRGRGRGSQPCNMSPRSYRPS
jgi:hypothetical protein